MFPIYCEKILNEKAAQLWQISKLTCNTLQWAILLTSNDVKSGSGGGRVGWGEEYTWEPNCTAHWHCFDKDKCCNHPVLYDWVDHNDNLGFLSLLAFPHHFRSWTIQSNVKVFFGNSIKKIQIQKKRLLDHQISASMLDIPTLDWRYNRQKPKEEHKKSEV